MKKIIIRKIPTCRYVGVAEAARRLKVTRSAVHNFVSGRYRACLSKDKADKIEIIEG